MHLVVSKATTAEKESYSAFDVPSLAELLKNLDILSLEICGIATEYCVLSACHAAVDEKFAVEVRLEAIRRVAPGSEEEKKALEQMGLG
jgi:nicotinamidase/pyrazinamidase